VSFRAGRACLSCRPFAGRSALDGTDMSDEVQYETRAGASDGPSHLPDPLGRYRTFAPWKCLGTLSRKR
jgi:hypothetical protein